MRKSEKGLMILWPCDKCNRGINSAGILVRRICERIVQIWLKEGIWHSVRLHP